MLLLLGGGAGAELIVEAVAALLCALSSPARAHAGPGALHTCSVRMQQMKERVTAGVRTMKCCKPLCWPTTSVSHVAGRVSQNH